MDRSPPARPVDLTLDPVRHDTVSPKESALHGWLGDALAAVGCSARQQPLHAGIARHPRRSRVGHRDGDAAQRSNLRASLGSHRADLPTLLVSAHLDTVPAADDFPHASRGRYHDGAVIGRGAADPADPGSA